MIGLRCIAAVAVVTLAVMLISASHAGVTLEHSVVGSGAGVTGNGTASVSTTLGQAIVGAASGSPYVNEIGFWFQPEHYLAGLDTLQSLLPYAFELGPGCPNPFVNSASLRFSVPCKSRVTIALYDVEGRLMRKLIDEEVEQGHHSVQLDGSGLLPGVYFCRMHTYKCVMTRKLVVLR
ncbi:T9SS type A sorting domain-containing protein [Candidatus Eisenbacteria bacterium]|uniref:T9SS type A sorting domain-containing protein n=1 Tax=Eiseniibacteriota bacterium TaxID=2212470 RepID=A0ABV6YP89_UNCEI